MKEGGGNAPLNLSISQTSFGLVSRRWPRQESKLMDRVVKITIHDGGNVSTDFDGLGNRLVWRAIDGTVDKETRDGRVLEVYKRTSRNAFVLECMKRV